MSENYDAVVIGSGIGGLTCGAFLARSGKKVLVLEKHSKIGGYAHNFKRRKFEFESGIHCVPMKNDGIIMHILRLLGVENNVKPQLLNEMYNVQTPEFSFTMPPEQPSIIEYLHKTFPHEKNNIDALFRSLTNLYHEIEMPVLDFEDNFVEENREILSQFHGKSYKEYVDSFIKDDKLRFFLYGQWPYGGSSPDSSPTVFYAIMYIVHVLESSHTLKGGFSTLADALRSVIEKQGGKVKTKITVTGIQTKNDKVTSVTCDSKETFNADVFISNISPYILHNELLPEESRNRQWKRRLNNLNPSVSTIAVYLGMKPEINDLTNHNIDFWFGHTDNAQIYQNIINNKKDNIDHLILMKSTDNPEYPTVTLMNFAKKSLSNDWKNDKIKYGNMLIDQADKIYPGFKDLIEITEIGSPQTFERYTANTDGSLYGFENTKKVYGEAKIQIKTHIKNLFQVGHWGKPGGGVHNVMVNGYTAYHLIKQLND